MKSLATFIHQHHINLMNYLQKNRLTLWIGSLTSILIIASLSSFFSIHQLNQAAERVNHTNVVKYTLSEIFSTLRAVESGRRGYLLTYDSSFMIEDDKLSTQLNVLYKSLDSLFLDNPPQQRNALHLKALVSERLYAARQTLQLSLQQRPPDELRTALQAGKRKMDEVKAVLNEMQSEENRLLIDRTALNDKLARTTPLLALIASLSSIIVLTILYAKTKEESQQRKRANDVLNAKNDELEQQQDFVDAVFDASVDVMSLMDTNLNLIRFNKAGSAAYQRSKEELIGKSVLELYPHIRNTGLYAELQKTIAGETIHIREYYSPTAQKYFELFLIPLKNRQGVVESVLSVAHDITTIVESKMQLQLQNHQLELTNQELASFSYIASHDLKEPLRKIQVFSKRIQETSTMSERATDYFNRIISASERMQNLIDSLLHFSQANNSELNFIDCDLKDILKEATNYTQETIREKQPDIIADNLPVVKGLPAQLTQLFTNLLDNALKYSKEGTKPRIHISAHITNGKEIKSNYVNRQKDYYRIDFTDNGIGFDQQFEPKIFEIFQRLHPRHLYSGTGIGLAICKKIVSNHNGFITARGIEGQGATFSIYLPKA